MNEREEYARVFNRWYETRQWGKKEVGSGDVRGKAEGVRIGKKRKILLARKIPLGGGGKA